MDDAFHVAVGARMRLISSLCLAGIILTWVGARSASAMDELSLTIRNHRYEPNELTVPTGVKIKLLINNADDTPEEFESVDLNREKIVAPGSQIQVIIGPLSSGRYEFFGDFHPDTARGHIVVP